MPDWIANDRDDYVDKAIAFASDLNSLSQLRESLREQVLASRFFDAPQFAEDFQTAVRQMWRRCNQDQ